jgi:amino-acid N-acetyltransferase
MKIQKANKEDLQTVLKLLAENILPVDDLKENNVEFFVGLEDENIVSVVGLERFSGFGFLRSLAVKEDFKNRSFGKKLVKYLLEHCASENLRELYLMTTSAEKYFEKFGFAKVERENAPEEIKQSRQFRDLCPSTAVVMHRKEF